MKNKSSGSIILFALFSFSLLTINIIPAYSAETARITVLATSDTHGHILGWDYLTASPADLGLAKISTLVKEERKKSPDTILIDAGDFLQGSPLVTYCNTVDKKAAIHPIVQTFNAMQYDALVLGNHEFNYGIGLLQKIIGQSKAPVLSANTYSLQDQGVWKAVKPYIIKKFYIEGQPFKVGIIGTVTPAIPNFENKANYSGLSFRDQVLEIRKNINQLKNMVDIIIVATHSGVELTHDDWENQVGAIAKACPGIALIIAGHRHVTIDNQNPIRDVKGDILYDDGIVNGVPIMAPAQWGLVLSKGELILKKINGKWKLSEVRTSSLSTQGIKDDPKIVNLAQSAHKATLHYLKRKIGIATGNFSGINGTTQDTALVNLINQVQRYYGKAQLGAAAFFNPNAGIKKGEITLQDIYSLYIYENYMYTIKINGQQLRQYLEHAAKFYKQFSQVDGNIVPNHNGVPDYNYDMIQGVSYSLDITKPEGQRVKELIYQSKNVQDSDIFSLALNNYRFNGGGGYMEAMGFKGNKSPEVLFDSQKAFGDDGQVRNLIISYIEEKASIQPIVENNWKIVTSLSP